MLGSAQVGRVWVWRVSAAGLLIALVVMLAAGCSRQAFRERTDRDVEAIITQKNVVPQWKVENWHAYPDPRARFADPSCPDFPPYPPDDYAARLLSPNPQKPGRGGAGRRDGDGYLHQLAEWDVQNRVEDAAAEPADAPAAIRPPGPAADPAADAAYRATFASDVSRYRMRLDQAVELAYYNSREFQNAREDLYLAALPVSLERYSFSAQAFAAEQVIREIGGEQSASPGDHYTIGTDAGFGRRFATGAELLVRLANQVVVDVGGGGQPTVSVSTLGLSLVVPFLRGAGFAVTLEALTQAERTLLYAIRSYARFRSNFYVAIAGTGNYVNTPYGFQGLSQNLGRGIGSNLTAVPVGFLPTVLRAALVRNEEGNVAAFEEYLRRYQNLKEGGTVTELQVGRIEQQLLTGRTTVLTRQQQYIDNIDNFKLQLGLPATVPIELDDAPVRPLKEQVQRIEGVYRQLRDLEAEADRFDPQEDPAKYRSRWRRLLTESSLAKGTPLAAEFAAAADQLAKLADADVAARVADAKARQQKLLDARVDRQANNRPFADVAAALDAVERELDVLQFEQAARAYESKPWQRIADPKRREAEQAVAFRAVLNAGMLVAVVARNQRLVALRGRWPEAPPIEVGGRDVVRAPLDDAYRKVAEAALVNRTDLMNARAQVVDAWRQITVQANSLQGVFDVEYDLTTGTPVGTTRAFDFGGSRTLHQIKLRLEPPFVRRAERNNYRAALIAYQRQRRTLQAFEDNIVTDTRNDLRQLRQLDQTFLVQQRAVELAYAQVDNARGVLLAPPDPKADASASAAAQTEQLLQVQGALVQAQNALYTTWVTYLTARMELYLDLDALPLDSKGLWADDRLSPPACEPARPAPARPGAPAGPDRPAQPPERLPDPAPTPVAPDDPRGGLPPVLVPVPAVGPALDLAAPRGDAGGLRPDPFPPLTLPEPPPGR